MRKLVKKKEYFAAAMLCSSAIDVLADARQIDYVEKQQYIEAVIHYFPGSYGRDQLLAELFYKVLRSGLIHRVQLEPRPDDGRRAAPVLSETLIVLGAGGKGPREAIFEGQPFLVIDVPHLIKEFDLVYSRFKSNANGDAQQRFAKRLQQTVFIEEPDETLTLAQHSSLGAFATSLTVSGGCSMPTLYGFGRDRQKS